MTATFSSHTSTLAAALDAAERGWPVFPLRSNDKRPAFPNHTAERCTGGDPRCRVAHHGWEPRATTDPDRIRRAWSMHPYNVGIATGRAGLLVIDLDQPKEGNDTPPAHWRLPGVTSGADVLAVLAERAGASLAELLDTFTVTTGRGGLHLYFAAPRNVQLRNTESKLGWLIDTRAQGGYVVAAGSTVAGKPYRLTLDRKPAPLPSWTLQLLSPPPAPIRQPGAAPAGAARRSAYVEKVLREETGHVRIAPVGGRRKALYLAALNLGRLVAGGALPVETARSVLEGCAAEHIAAGAYTQRRADGAISDGLTAGAQRPRALAA